MLFLNHGEHVGAQDLLSQAAKLFDLTGSLPGTACAMKYAIVLRIRKVVTRRAKYKEL
jgi:hypothetical protein